MSALQDIRNDSTNARRRTKPAPNSIVSEILSQNSTSGHFKTDPVDPFGVHRIYSMDFDIGAAPATKNNLPTIWSICGVWGKGKSYSIGSLAATTPAERIDAPQTVTLHIPDQWERALSALGGLNTGWAGPESLAPSNETKSEVHTLVELVKKSARLPDFEIDDSVGSVTLKWSVLGSKGYLAITCRGNGVITINARTADRRVMISQALALNSETENEILSAVNHVALRDLVAPT